MDKYDHTEIERKWQEIWEKNRLNVVDIVEAKKPFYNLWMFPYPSAEGLHVGHAFASTVADVYGRFKRHRGFDVFEPIGYDSFGIHSENFALKIGEHPRKFTQRAVKNYERQLRMMGHMYDWTRTVATSDPDYYKWTQWVFLQMYKKGLAYRGKALVNWCPTCKTVLSDEQVIDGKCERTADVVLRKEMEQWFFKITAYAERLLANLDGLDWTKKIKTTQKNWIGKSEGVRIDFAIKGSNEKIRVFTTAHDTIYGVSFMVVSPEYANTILSLVPEEKGAEVRKYIKKSLAMTEEERVGDRTKTGVEMGIFVVNPFSGTEVPVFVADYVLSSYGTGAVMGVPGHDARDHEFALKYRLPVIPVVRPTGLDIKVGKDGFWDYADIKYREAENGVLFNSGILDGLNSKEARRRIEDEVDRRQVGEKVSNFHLRDWLISRQRYWGPPIPMINCPKCGWVPVPEADLPVLLPDISDYQPEGTGKGPLANHPEFYKTKCPKCGGEAERETDVSDTFLDSAWYELRYPSVGAASSGQAPFDKEITKKWLPVDMYTGGAEHAVLHLMYFRFVTMVLFDLGYLGFEEPTKSFFAHGLIIKDGAKMSKSRGNVVNPDEYITKYGADALRLYFMFMGPAEQGGDFRDSGMVGMRRWAEKVHRIINDQLIITSGVSDKEVDFGVGKLVRKATEGLEARHNNVVIAAMMEFLNFIVAREKKMTKVQIEAFLIVFSVFAPHLGEELYQSLRNQSKSKKLAFQSVHQLPWPEARDIEVEKTVTIVVSVNGKPRATLNFSSQEAKLLTEDRLVKTVQSDNRMVKYLSGVPIKKVVYVPGKIVNFVV